MSSDGTISIYCSLNWGFLYHVRRSLLNMLYITHSSGNFSWNDSWPIFFVISKGLYLFWSNFFECCFNWIFLVSNYILSSYFSSWKFYLLLLNCFFIASFAFFIDIFTVFQILCSSLEKVSSFGNYIFIVRSLFYRCCPKLSISCSWVFLVIILKLCF